MGPADKRDRVRGALWGMFVGDALAMPAHWYYDTAALRRDFGSLRDYRDPPDRHPSSFMAQASTGTAGRGSQKGDVVGGVILHGKKPLWGRPNLHYHYGLQRGDNTLNLLCARVLVRSMIARRAYDRDDFLQRYVEFMTTPDSHRDTYAESYHRDFFANYARGVALDQCAGEEGHDTASIGGLVALPPVVIGMLGRGDEAVVEREALQHVRLTHRSRKLEPYAAAYARLLCQLLQDTDRSLKTLACKTAESLGFPLAKIVERVDRERLPDLRIIGGVVSPACYIEHALPAVLYLAARYADDLETALVANADVGGDNCHRGAVLGAILGAALGVAAIPERWIAGLRDREALQEEIESFVGQFVTS